MNDTRRKAIKEVMDRLETIKEDLECIIEEEDEYRDNMPDNLKNSERYETSEMDSSYLSEVLESVESAIGDLGEIE